MIRIRITNTYRHTSHKTITSVIEQFTKTSYLSNTS